MKNLIKRIFIKRMSEADLNREALKGAAAYLKNLGSGVPLDEKIRSTNYAAHGFYMGWRKLEEQLGLKPKK